MLTDEQKEIIDGILLGDGCLYIPKNGKNASLRFLAKNKDHVEYIFKYFKDFCNFDDIKSRKYFDKRTSKIYQSYYFFTKSKIDFTEIYYKWYKNGKKRLVPKNIILSKKILLTWYIDDGCLHKDGRLSLSTDCFDEESVKNLVSKLSNFSAKYEIRKNNSIKIIIPRIKSKDFLNFIGKCPIKSYDYKWNVKDYKIKAFERGVNRITSDELNQYINLYNSGLTYYRISKIFNVSVSKVQHALERAGVYVKKRDSRKINISDEDIKKIIILIFLEVKWREIEKIFNFSRKVILKFIVKNNNIWIPLS